MPKRQVIQIQPITNYLRIFGLEPIRREESLIALCNDGTMWWIRLGKWVQLKGPPGCVQPIKRKK